MNGLSPDAAVAAYVQRAREEFFDGNLAELVRRVEAVLGRSYARNAGQGWVSNGNAPGRVLFAIHRLTGISLDDAARVQEQPLSVDGRLANLERQYERLTASIEQLRRELGQPAQATRDSQVSDEASAQGPLGRVP